MPRDAPRVVYLGALGPFSYAPLAALLAAGVPICAVVVARAHRGTALPGASLTGGSGITHEGVRRLVPAPRMPSALPLLDAGTSRTIVDLAWEHEIPVLEVGRLTDPACLAALAAAAPDVICVACFPQILPPPLLALPRFGCLNLHPSMLPAHRGPAPLFWAFRAGETRTGVTVHIMDERIDAGDLLFRKSLVIPEGIPGTSLEEACASQGAKLMVEAVGSLPDMEKIRRPQNEAEASYESWPTLADLEIPTTRPALWAFNFIRGAGDWYPLTLVAGERRFRVRRAVAWTPEGDMDQPYLVSGGEAWVGFSPGVLRVEVVP
jgi:methionyl-tRNA formyltransferase